MLSSALKSQVKETLAGFRLDWLLTAFRSVKFAYYRTQPRAQIFAEIYRSNGWNGVESASGAGSDLWETKVVRSALPQLLADLNVRSMLDVPCGDFNWMKEVRLGDVDYIGGDIVPDIVKRNTRLYAAPRREFRRLDIIEDELPRVDMIFCRDALVHFPYREVSLTLENFRRSSATYLLTTTFPKHANRDVSYMSLWRPLNLQAEPFNLPAPLMLINEQCSDLDFMDKSLALWRITDLTR